METYGKEVEKLVITSHNTRLIENALGLAGEAGEVAEKVKKLYRDSQFSNQDVIKELMKTNPDKAKEIAASFIKEFKVPKLTGFITEARHGEFLSHAISKIADD